MKKLIEKLEKQSILTKEEYAALIRNPTPELADILFEKSVSIRQKYYGRDVYIRGLIEFTSYCKNDCYYCGLRCSNRNAQRYRLTKDEILDCCRNGYGLGFRTFVLQGGEDPYFTRERLVDIISSIKNEWPDCALTLSVGEKTYEEYKAYYDAGADRYLLRHETANDDHYRRLHPKELSPENRKRCLRDLKSIGYQVGCGFMVGSPWQTEDDLAEDLLFIKELQPQMVGIGPFIPQHDTPFGDKRAGTLELTLFMLGLLRLTVPYALLPATTALGTIDPLGREKGIQAGANVVMPNLSPVSVRKKYLLYDNKICTGDEAAECKNCLEMRMKSIGYNVVVSRGDCCNFKLS
ncbi:MAG: [Clostridia bacterium]|nr:[FeFe] hydrogenase H-cluster radical SAM maturase HydE [Clostridia bacterium]